ncbi:hypothetical protein BDW02DRAFT_531344 [Decorospora gaudefroyi]|uniref:Sld7 C-terminal domain-containing protein n=1 Tax=Decorospora gaudefroyi TaxID=184978 RepID=A0A6A5K3R8_9PLEO|nr:hypothetical protein BDW02DRAFT_531344 [Decorospora gaudefroyi]
MADIWSGEILLPDGNFIKDVGLASQNVASSVALPATALRFLSTVDTAQIPLYLAAGTSLDVWTTSEATETWFESILLSQPVDAIGSANNAWWNLARSQSQIGILMQVEAAEEHEHVQRPCVTEILFYGTVSATPTTGGLPTPPSASPFVDNAQGGPLPQLRVHALPLSSHLLYPSNVQVPNDAEAEAQFLPPSHEARSAPDSPKRKRDIFEEATIANKKARGRGGKGVAAAAARGSETQQAYRHRKSSLSIDTKASPFPDSRPPSASGALSRPSSRQLSRSPSLSSDTRPLSHKGQAEAHTRRSNLSHVATLPLQPEEPTTESRNKDALAKVVMAAMRMHGLQQRKQNRSRRASAAPGLDEQLSEEAAAEEAAKDDEYKLIYHQTYKGAALALRKHIAEKPLHAQPARMRDVVEKLLTLFLSDPLAEEEEEEPIPSTSAAAASANNPLATPAGAKRTPGGPPGTAHSHASPFDLPSTSRPSIVRCVTNGLAYTGSPVRRRGVEVEMGPV